MKVATQRSFRTLHTWTGIVTGLALFIAFYAGAISVFVNELSSWQDHGEIIQPESDRRGQLLVDLLLTTHPAASAGFRLVIPSEYTPFFTAYWYDNQSGMQRKYRLSEQDELVELPAQRDFVAFIYDLHFTAGLPKTFGTYLFGIFCLLYGLALVSGVVIYAPVFLKDLFALRLGNSIKRMWQDAHNIVGVLSLPFHILFAWSGAVLTIGFIMLAPFQLTIFDGELLEILEPDFEVMPHVEPAETSAPLVPFTNLIDISKGALSQMQINSLFYHDAGDTNGNVTVYGPVGSESVTDTASVVINSASGTVLKVLTPDEFTPGTTFLRGLQNLHYGNYGNYPVKWMYFVLGLAGAFLFYSGNLLWLESRRRSSEQPPPKHLRVMTGLTLGVSLGCVAGISALFVVGNLVSVSLHSSIYYFVFFAIVGWCLVRQPAKAAVEALALTTLLTALIPVTSYISSGEFILTSALKGHWMRFGVDITALLMALCFWRLTIAVNRRTRHGPSNTIWSIKS